MTQEQELFTILSSMILDKIYCRLDKEDLNSKYKDSLFRVQGIQLLDSGKYLMLLECMDDLNGRFTTSNILQIKPYLRPMSSMTEEEKKELRDKNILIAISTSGKVEITIDGFDWLNKKHFDYRGLIPMELALEAPEGMYDTKKKN